MVGIKPHLRREVEGYRKPVGPLGKQVTVAAIAFLGRAEARVLAHGPQPGLVHVAVDTAGVGKFAGLFSHNRSFMSGKSCGLLRKRRHRNTPSPRRISP